MGRLVQEAGSSDAVVSQPALTCISQWWERKFRLIAIILKKESPWVAAASAGTGVGAQVLEHAAVSQQGKDNSGAHCVPANLPAHQRQCRPCCHLQTSATHAVLPAFLPQSVEGLTLPRIGLLQTERLDRLSWHLEMRLLNLFSVSQSLQSVDQGMAAKHLQHWQPSKVAGE